MSANPRFQRPPVFDSSSNPRFPNRNPLTFGGPPGTTSTDQTFQPPNPVPPPSPQAPPAPATGAAQWVSDPVYSEIVRDAQGYTPKLDQLADVFRTTFKNLTGGDPNPADYTKFFQAAGPALVSQPGQLDYTTAQNAASGFVGQQYKPQVEGAVTKKLEDLGVKAKGLSQQYLEGATKGLNSVQDQLNKYAMDTLNKLRPNLITSLGAQGLLHSGATDEAFAGASKDLASDVLNFTANQALENQNVANRIAFSGASAPYNFAQSQALGTIPQLDQFYGAANRTAGGYQDFANSMALNAMQQKYWEQQQPSLFREFAGSFTNSFGQSVGQNLGNQFAPPKLKFGPFSLGKDIPTSEGQNTNG